jgi:N-acyl-D-aspartate/D-glutamate deacylase
VLQTNDRFPERHRNTIKWLKRCNERGLPVYAQAQTTGAGMTMTFEDWNMFDDSEAWNEATTGTLEDRMRKLADPARRPQLRQAMEVLERGAITKSFADIVVLKAHKDSLQRYHDQLIGEIAAREGKHCVDVMLDIAVEDDLRTVFYVEAVGASLELTAEVARYPYSLFGVSDGGAHTKFFTAGRYPTETLIRFVRDNDIISLEEAHFRLSAFAGHCAGFRDRGTLREGAPADVVVYNLDELAITDMEVAHDMPGGEWRRIQKAVGYRCILVNGQPTFIDGKETGALPGRLLRHGGRVTAT